mmetsp:Transcript_109443/g.304503  ORF Transcript_109443/g.304503 Transcript_109443/m.304503 type:complete len:243 (-) Transcript_109443:24-752(-)
MFSGCCCRDRIPVLGGAPGSSRLEARPVLTEPPADGFASLICGGHDGDSASPEAERSRAAQWAVEDRGAGQSRSSGGGDADDDGLVREALATFVRTLVRGLCLEVVLDDGSVLLPQAFLNYDLTHLTLHMNEAQRSIPLQDVDSVATPSELRARNLDLAIHPHIDERCCTLIIGGREFITIRLDNERHREYFAACLTLLVSRSANAKREGATAAPCGRSAGDVDDSESVGTYEDPAVPSLTM